MISVAHPATGWMRRRNKGAPTTEVEPRTFSIVPFPVTADVGDAVVRRRAPLPDGDDLRRRDQLVCLLLIWAADLRSLWQLSANGDGRLQCCRQASALLRVAGHSGRMGLGLAVTVSMQFKAGGQPISGARGPITGLILSGGGEDRGKEC